MKIILHIVIACLILLSSNALNLSSSRRRASTEAAAYMRLTNLLGYTNGYKALAGFGSSTKTVFYCDLFINGQSVIHKSTSVELQKSSYKNGLVSSSTTTKTTTTTTVTEIIKLNESFELTINTIRSVSSIESNNSLKLIANLNLDQQIKDKLFTKVDNDNYRLNLDPLNLMNATNNWQPQTIQLTVSDKKGLNVKIDLVVKNFKTISNAKPTDATEKGVKDLTEIMIAIKKEKLANLRRDVQIIVAHLTNLQSAIKIKILYLRKQNETVIYQGEIKRLQEEKSKCLQERARLQKEYDSYELQWVEIESSSKKLTEEIKTCKSKVESIEIEIESVQNKITKNIQEEKTRLLNLNKESYTHIFYWLEASYFYRVFSSKLVADVNEVTVKFAEDKIKNNSIKLSEVFYPLETDLSFMS